MQIYFNIEMIRLLYDLDRPNNHHNENHGNKKIITFKK